LIIVILATFAGIPEFVNSCCKVMILVGNTGIPLYLRNRRKENVRKRGKKERFLMNK